MSLARKTRPFLPALALLVFAWNVEAGSIDLQWDAVAGATGYRVYYGPESGHYTKAIDVGNRTTATVSGLADCTTWHVAVKTYNRQGESAGFSNEISGWPRPQVKSVSPDIRIQGSRFTLEVRGSNFAPGAAVEMDTPHVFFGSTAVLACDRIELATTIEPTARGVRAAEIGRYSLTVVNPDDTFGTGNRVFEVRIDPSRFDLDRRSGPSEGRLDGRDTIWLSRFFATREGDPGHHPDPDFDGNGWVDGADLAHLVSNLGRCWTGTGWSLSSCTD